MIDLNVNCNILTHVYFYHLQNHNINRTFQKKIVNIFCPFFVARFINSKFYLDYLIDWLKTCPVNNFPGK